jgi:hypothetical protein
MSLEIWLVVLCQSFVFFFEEFWVFVSAQRAPVHFARTMLWRLALWSVFVQYCQAHLIVYIVNNQFNPYNGTVGEAGDYDAEWLGLLGNSVVQVENITSTVAVPNGFHSGPTNKTGYEFRCMLDAITKMVVSAAGIIILSQPCFHPESTTT